MSNVIVMNSLLGVKIPVQVPGTEAEVNAALQDPNAYRDAAMAQFFYRYYNPEVRPLIAARLEETTGVKRRINTSAPPRKVKGPDGKTTEEPVLITEQVYVNELFRDKAIDEASYEKLVLEVAAEYGAIRLTPDTGRSGKPAKVFMDRAAAMISGIESGSFVDKSGQPVTVERFISEWSDRNGMDFNQLGEWSQETLARALKLNEDRKNRAAAQTLSLD